MEESEIHIDGAPPDANAPNENRSVSISSIFQDGCQNKKVIVLQSPGLENENSIQVQGELPNLMDAVGQPGDSVQEPMQLATEITYETNNQSAESVETVSAIEETNNVLNVSVSEANNMEVSEYVTQGISDQNLPEGQELIYIHPDDIKDQDVQFIDVSAPNELVANFQGNVPTDAVAQAFQQAVADTDLTVKQEEVTVPTPKRAKPNQYVSKEDSRTRFLCPVCEKSFRQKHLLLCHIKLHDGRPKSNSVYMSNCTTCGGNVRLTSEQARLLQERGTEDARIICSTCKILGHDVIQQQKTVPIELKPAFNFACDMCGCDIKLTDDQLQLVERKGAENIRIICAPCSMKDQDAAVEPEANSGAPDSEELKCNVCHRTIVVTSRDSINRSNPTCAECHAKGEDEMAVDNINPSDDTFTSNCTMCHKELFFAEKPPRGVKVVCESCKNKKLGRTVQSVQPAESPAKPVESLAVMYKCNNCFCNMQLSAEQKELLRVRGVCGTKIICASCHAKETSKAVSSKKPRVPVRTYQCDICLMDMAIDYTPKEDDDIICSTCQKAEEKEQYKSKVSAGIKRPSTDNTAQISKTPINRCCTCNKVLPLSRAQMQKLKEKGSRARVKCLACNRKTEEELRKTKKIIKTEDGVDYRCEICSISFGQRFDDFTEHFSRVHVPETDPDRTSKGLHKSKKPLIHCPICDAAFTDRANLKMHMNTHKPAELHRASGPRKSCPLCYKMLDRAQMLEHYKNFHKIEIAKIHYSFKSGEELREWKTNQEVSTNTKFVVADLSRPAKVVKGRSGVMISLKCQYAVHRKGEQKEYPTVFCPARMIIHERPTGRIDVEYIESHVGHGDLSNFPEEDQQLIVEMLKGDSPVEEVIEELRKHYNDPESEELLRSISGLKRLNLIAVRKELGLDSNSNCNSDNESEGDGAMDSDREESVMRYVDLPVSLSWLNEPAENGQYPGTEITQNEASFAIQDTGDGYKLDFRPPSNAEDPLAAKKFEILRRLTEVLNKCTCDEHLEIVDVYLNPCEQTLNELSSGRTVEIVDEDSTPDENLSLKDEETDTVPLPQRSKNELSDSNAT